ncbi:hypothetical protein C0991_003183 [Blastosporella zonata]|nr:hypothetical protein C0991_003183 [Blastosporella zonata]
MADDSAARDETISDLEWMNRRMGNTVDVVEKVFEPSDDEDGPSKPAELLYPHEPKATEPEPPKDPTIETILQTAPLFVRNLAFSCTYADLCELFTPFGDLSQVRLSFAPLFVASRRMGDDDNLNRDIRHLTVHVDPLGIR